MAGSFRATYNVAITSVNPEEVLTLYNLVKAIFIGYHAVFTNVLNYRQFEISGMDIQLPEFQDRGNVLFTRGVQVSFSYLRNYPSFLEELVITDICTNEPSIYTN